MTDTRRPAYLAQNSEMNPHVQVPKTAREAMESSESTFWIKAMEDELQSFNDCNAWTLVVPQARSKIVGNKWVFKTKQNPDGTLLYRARLVAKGYTQTYGVDYYETFAPVVKRSTLRLLFSVAVNSDLKVSHLDVKTAFLNGDLSEMVFMSQPEGFVAEGYEDHICRLHKAVYGLKQAARSWNLKADEVLKRQGFVNFSDEPCVYIKRRGNSIIIIALYVDDFFIFYNCDWEKNTLLKILQSHFNVKDLGEIKTCLGMKIERDWNNGTLLMHQEDYINSILCKFNMKNCNPSETPMEFRVKLKDLKGGEKGAEPYQELIGCLLYLSICTRPDISYAVSFLSQFNNCHTKVHWNLAKRLLAYLKSTPRVGLKYSKSKNPTFCLIGFADADFAGNPSDYKSYSGYCFKLDNNLISWESKKQKLAAQSTTESEYIAVTEAVKESKYLNELVNNLFDCGYQKVTIFNDNMSTIKLALSSNFSARTKHFGCRMQFVRDAVQDGEVQIEHMSSSVMPADILTKPLGASKHVDCSINIGLSMKPRMLQD
jgi:histone deacetylase 1/2